MSDQLNTEQYRSRLSVQCVLQIKLKGEKKKSTRQVFRKTVAAAPPLAHCYFFSDDLEVGSEMALA